MQYFVSAENSSYFYWQLELLIESFLMQGLDKDLVIGLAQNDDQKIRGYSSNLVKYGTKFMVQNEGRESRYLPLNRISAIRSGLAQGVLKFPFVMIHADMILKKPLELEDEGKETGCGIIINNFEEPDPVESSFIASEMDGFVEKLAKEKDVEKEEIPRIPFFSAPVVFTKFMEYCSDVFFAKVHSYERSLLAEYGPKFPCEKTAWEMAIAEAFRHFNVKGDFMSAPLMFGGENFNFIHYKSGIPPVFHKKYFKFEGGTYLSSSGPYEVLMDHNPNGNTNYLQQVIRSYKKRNNR